MANYMMVGSKELGEEIFKIEDGKVNVNLNEKVMRKLWDDFYVPYINGHYGAYGRFRSDDTKTGDIIAFVGSTPGAEYFPSSVIKNDETSYPIDCMVLPIPKFENYKGYMPEQGAGIVLTKSDRKHEYAVTEFLKWFTDVERNTEFSIKSGYLPVKKDANNINFIKSKIAKNNDLDISQKLQDAIFTAIDQENSNEFYFVKAFNGSNKARDILEKAMLDKAKLDREEIQKQLNNGISKKDLINKYDTDENFKRWLEKFKNDINNAM
ncbi:extracellular solute-binding protein [Clostridium saccharoperbutylacetonicum]|uniref:extracellular solute-binding protein n=1 Tax=Clostridium saccharoperbutylacetonicum TaxID=36745 RepID=UPI0039ED110B